MYRRRAEKTEVFRFRIAPEELERFKAAAKRRHPYQSASHIARRLLAKFAADVEAEEREAASS